MSWETSGMSAGDRWETGGMPAGEGRAGPFPMPQAG